MKVQRKGQVVMEMLFGVGVVVVIFMIMLGFTFQRQLDLENTKDLIKKKNE